MTSYLLDINLLLALTDPLHVHHAQAHQWFSAIGIVSWATCPITENGFIRIASNPRYPNSPGESETVLSILRQFCELEGHHFWGANISIIDFIRPGSVLTHNQITDIYLLGLAVFHNGKLATLDNRIPASLIKGGKEALELIAL